jgi:hypothetical protein
VQRAGATPQPAGAAARAVASAMPPGHCRCPENQFRNAPCRSAIGAERTQAVPDAKTHVASRASDRSAVTIAGRADQADSQSPGLPQCRVMPRATPASARPACLANV